MSADSGLHSVMACIVYMTSSSYDAHRAPVDNPQLCPQHLLCCRLRLCFNSGTASAVAASAASSMCTQQRLPECADMTEQAVQGPAAAGDTGAAGLTANASA